MTSYLQLSVHWFQILLIFISLFFIKHPPILASRRHPTRNPADSLRLNVALLQRLAPGRKLFRRLLCRVLIKGTQVRRAGVWKKSACRYCPLCTVIACEIPRKNPSSVMTLLSYNEICRYTWRGILGIRLCRVSIKSSCLRVSSIKINK